MRPLAILLLALCTATGAAAQTLTVAAASDLQAVMPDIAKRFERETRIPVTTTFGSSGNFFAQIRNGAPFDLFFSADVDYPERLEDAGLAERGSLYEYATGHIVLWTRKDSGVALTMGMGILASPRVRRIAIANPEVAPYGRAAVAALQHAGLYKRSFDASWCLARTSLRLRSSCSPETPTSAFSRCRLPFLPPFKRPARSFGFPRKGTRQSGKAPSCSRAPGRRKPPASFWSF